MCTAYAHAAKTSPGVSAPACRVFELPESTMRIYMQIAADDDTPPRYYQLVLQADMLSGWTLVREWGRVGAAGRVRREHFDSWEDAEGMLIKARDSQIHRGYRVVFTQGQDAPQ